MAVDYLLLLAGLLILFASGKYLVESSVVIASHFKIPTMIIGLTVVSFGTSAPELLVSLKAALSGYPEIAVGNVVGSNISNILLVLAITAIIFPIPVPLRSLKRDWTIMMFVSVLFFLLILDGILQRWEGMILLFLLFLYIWYSVISARKENRRTSGGLTPTSEGKTPTSEGKTTTSEEKARTSEGRTTTSEKDHRTIEEKTSTSEEITRTSDEKNGEAMSSMKWWVAAIILLASVAGLAAGANLLVDKAAFIAETLGISQRVISISMIAVGTSIPELATSVIAALKKETGISLGNILGSNLMNIVSVIGLTATITPINIDRNIAIFDTPWMMGAALLLLLLILAPPRFSVNRWKGVLMVLVYLLYLYLII